MNKVTGKKRKELKKELGVLKCFVMHAQTHIDLFNIFNSSKEAKKMEEERLNSLKRIKELEILLNEKI